MIGRKQKQLEGIAAGEVLKIVMVLTTLAMAGLIFAPSAHAGGPDHAADGALSDGLDDSENTEDLEIDVEGSTSTDDNSDENASMVEDEFEELEDIGLFELDVPVVVTAARREQKMNAVPYAISVITRDDIRKSGARTIADALRLAAGVDVADLTYSNHAITPRGLHGFVSRQVLVLVDGRQIFDALFGGTLWGSWPLALDDIERIEVIRGPGGVVWGANAVNGVINIISRAPGDQPGLTLTTRGGTQGQHRQYIGYAANEKNWSLRISGEYEGSDGFKEGGSFLRGLDDDLKAARFNIHAVYSKDPNDKFTLAAGHSSVDGGFPTTPLAGFGLQRHSGSQANFILAKWEHVSPESGSSGLTFFVNDFYVSPGLPQIDYRYQQIALQFANTLESENGHTFTWGVDSRIDMVDATNSDPYMLTKDRVNTGIVGVYVQDEWQFAPRWSLALGGRIDYEFYGGFHTSARASLSYELTNESFLYGSVSRAFQVAPAPLNFMDIPLFNGLANASGRRGLGDQTLLAYELGYRTKLLEKVDLNLNLFFNEYDDITTLSPTLGPPGLINSALAHRGNASTYGAEIEAKYRVNDKFTLLGNYTYQDLNWRADVKYTDTESISPPHHKFMLGARYDHTEDLHLSSHLYYVDAVKSPNPANPFVPRHIRPYFRWDVRGEYEFWDDKASIAIGATNLLDHGHYEGGTSFLNDAQVPRMVFVELRFAIP
ncbi:MAG TPA: TonB-dependent receptor [Phycisphaerae bacterium]|nr:TonB-dependent receptor [Phycisphaerae bacterium]